MRRHPPHRRRSIAASAAVCLVCSLCAALLVAWLVYVQLPMPAVALRAGFAALACTASAGGAALYLLWREQARTDARLAQLAARVDRIVRDPRCVQDFGDYEEGDLAILANELQKACTLLRDQAVELSRDRDRLADSLADISHQLRTPLASMNIALELLGNEAASPQRRRALLRDLQARADHMAWLVNALLALARADAGTLQLTRAPIDLAALVTCAVDPLRVAAELRGVTIQTAFPTAAASFEGDLGWSKEALANVVKNSLEHTPPGGTVRVEASQDALATRIEVTDTGPGIAARDLPHLFERFYRGEGAAPGSAGVGLALARCLAVAQGGTLVARNLAEGGACFTFSFPRTVV